MKQHEITKTQLFFLIVVVLALHDLLLWGYYITFHGSHISPSIEKKQVQGEQLENLGPAPEFELLDLASNTVSLSKLKGKIILVDFWGTWCKSCCEEMPDMDKVYRSFKEKGFELVAIAVEFDRNLEKRLQKVKKKVEELGVSCTIVLGDDSTVKAFGGKLENFPQTYLIDRKGQIRKKIVGARKEEYWNNLIRTAFSE